MQKIRRTKNKQAEFPADELRRKAGACATPNKSQRLPVLSRVLDGASRGDAV